MGYKEVGVDILGHNQLVSKIKELAKTTYNEHVLPGVRPFTALYEFGDFILTTAR